jgi:sigma54-dependent transcription regulator
MSPEVPRPECPAGPAPPGRFAWLWEKKHRRSALAEVQSALTKGWLDSEDRADLARVIEALRQSGDLSDRERFRVDLICRAIAAQDAGGTASGQGAT